MNLTQVSLHLMRPSLTASPLPSEPLNVNRNGSWLLRLPPELLVLIARCLANLHSSPYILTPTESTADALIAFSLTCKVIRGVCRSAGLFSRLTPPERKYLTADYEQLAGGASRLTSLGIDLGNSEVWEFCAHIMGTFQDLDRLVLCGRPKKMKDGFTHRFMSSGLGSRFSDFKGRSVTLKRASFNTEQAEMLFLLNRSNVATFNCIESKFSLSLGRCRDRRKVENLFPKLRSFVFSGPPSLPESFINRAFHQTFRFHYLFGDTDLRYFELRTGLRHLKGRRQDVARTSWRSHVPIWYETTRAELLRYLNCYCLKSLEVFVDADGLSGPFLDHAPLVHLNLLQYRYYPLFQKMRLLIFRCETPEILTSFESDSHDCTFGHLFREKDRSGSLPEHSIWYHVKPLSPYNH